MKTLYFMILLFLCTGIAAACSCSDYADTLKEKITHNYERSDWVIIGNVISITDPNVHQQKISSGDAILYEFEVITILKGLEESRKTITISRPRYYKVFEVGNTYIVHGIFLSEKYTHRIGDTSLFITGDCRRNKNLRHMTKKEWRIYRRLNHKF